MKSDPMVDNPDKLCTICLIKFASLLKADESHWKNQIEQRIFQSYSEEKSQSTHHDRVKRKCYRSDDETASEPMDFTTPKTSIKSLNERLFLELFLRGQCPLNSVLSERLAYYLVKQNQLNDFTLTLFSSRVTCLKRLVLNVKYLSRLECHILNQHPYLQELELIFKDSNNTRTNDLFYRYLCPSIESKFEEIYNVYAPFLIHDLHKRIQSESKEISSSSRYLIPRSSNLSEGFSHQKIFQTIFNSLHPMTLERLRILKIVHFKFFAAYHLTSARKYSLVDMSPLTKCATNAASNMPSSANFIPPNLRLILKLTNLTSLNLSNTDIKNHCLDLIVDSLTKLDTLDLSSCRLLTSFPSLLKLSSKLKWLNLYNGIIHLQRVPTIYQILYEFKSLEYLDISNDNPNQIPLNQTDYDINRFLAEVDCLPSLKYFDISGQKTVSKQALQTFLLSHSHLQFLGLFQTNEKYSQCLFDSTDPCYSKSRHYTYDLQELISTTLSEQDIQLYEPHLIEALKRYNERAGFVQKILYYIFFLTRSTVSKNQILLLEMILHTMSIHTTLPAVQMASTACIYNLTRTPLTDQINVRCLGKLVQAIINVMKLFPNQQQLQKNCLLTLCSDRLLHEPHFDFYRLASLVMHNLQNYTDLAIIQPGVAILALLTTRLTIDECTQLSSLLNFQRLLQLIEQQIDRLQTIQTTQQQQQLNQQNEVGQAEFNELDFLANNPTTLTGDDTLRFCLSLLWNLTDENPTVCERFIHSMGLHLFRRLMTLFASDSIVMTKIVGLLSNISEVAHLRTYLYSIDIIPLMRQFLNDSVLDVAFSAGGILAHLLYDQKDQEVKVELCQQMRETIGKWRNPETNMVTYRSFKPFIPLLHCTQIPVVQLWALWAIHHVCSTDRARYHRIIREEKLYGIIQSLAEGQISSTSSDPLLNCLLHSILHLLKSYRTTSWTPPIAVAS